MPFQKKLTLEQFVPCLSWLGGYDRKMLFKDFVAGVTVAVVLIPQVMAYAILAGLPPLHRILAGFF